MHEVWKPVVGYEGYYEVSSAGEVRSVNDKRVRKISSRVLKSGLRRDGYRNVVLSKDGVTSTKLVHVLVAQAFLGSSVLTVNHLDGDRGNNRVDNLEWLSIRDNIHVGRRCAQGSSFPGVAWDKKAQKWISRIQVEGTRIYLGLFESERGAAAAFQRAVDKVNRGEKVKSAARMPSSSHRGVHWDTERSKWVASISVRGRIKQLGRFSSEEEAAAAYRRACEELR